MSTADKIALGALVVNALTLVVASFAGLFAWQAAKAGRTSAGEARRSADAGVEAARAATELAAREADRDAARMDAERRSQADLVCCWYVADGNRRAVFVQNGSSQPVWDVRVRFRRRSATWSDVSSVFEGPLSGTGMFTQVIPPQPAGAAPFLLVDQDITVDHGSAEWFPLLQFRDVFGQVWHRDENAILQPQPLPAE